MMRSEPDPLPAIKTPWDSSTPSSSATPPSGALAGDVPPILVPDHTLIRRIGKGSYGEVWLARNVLGVYRAVKIVHRRAFDDSRPFEREFAGIQRFEPVSRSHESQLNILHVGRGPDCFYYVMELADDMGRGAAIDEASYAPRNLKSELLLHGRLSVDECLRLGLALTTALENLHRHKLVHRDIKPSNIVFVNGIPKLADIGLVAQAESTMSFVGTEGYLPPEGPGTVQADIFSLGKVLYELSTGHDRQQFPDLPTGITELPDRAALAELNEVLLRACAPDVRQRYQSAAEMHADLALLQSGKSVARLHAIERRLKFVARGGAAVAGIAVLATGLYLWQARQTHIVRGLAADKARLAAEGHQLADANRERLVRLNVANGIREMDQGDLGAALVWLSEALQLATNNPADADIQRIRIHHLLSQHPRLLHVFPHPASVKSAEFSPDEKRIITACMDGSIRIWDTDHDEQAAAEFHLGAPVELARFTREGKHIFTVQFDEQKQTKSAAILYAATGKPLFPTIPDVTSCALSPDDRWLAVALTNFVVQLIAVETGRVVAEATGHEDRIEMIAFSADSSQLLTASRDRTARRWEVSTGNPIGLPLLHAQTVSRAAFNCNASRIATVTASEGDGTAIQFQTWDALSGVPMGKPIPGDGSCTVLAFDPSGRGLLIGDTDGMLAIRDADSHAAIAPALGGDRAVSGFDFSPDGALVVAGSERGGTRIWDLETGRLAFPPLHNADRTEHLRFSSDGSRLLSSSDDGTVKVWDLAQRPDDGRLSLQSSDNSDGTVSPDGRQLLLRVINSPPYVRLVNLDLFKETDMPTAAADEIYADFFTFDRSGNQWAVGSGPKSYEEFARYWNVPVAVGIWSREGERIRHFSLPHPSGVRGVFFNEDGSQLLTICVDRTTRIWNTADGSLRQAIRWPEKDLAWVAVGSDWRTVVALCRDARGRHFLLREVQTGKQLGPPPEDNPDISMATFSPDGTRVATIGDNQCGRIWDARTGQPLTPYFKHGDALTWVEWSPNGRQVITAGLSPEVKVWDAATGGLALHPLTMRAKGIRGAHFSTDGRFIVAWSDDKFVRAWDAATGEAVTPSLPNFDHDQEAFVTAVPQLVTVSGPCVVRVWNLVPAMHRTEDLVDYSRLLAGGPLPQRDQSQPMDAGALAKLLHSLRSRQPQLFADSTERVREWHRRMVQEPRTPGQARAAIFHLEQLARLAPEDTTVPEQLNRYRPALIPARDPKTPIRLLDLTRAYTHSLELQRFGYFADLPRGRQTLGEIEYDLRGFIELDHRAEWTDYDGPFHPSAVILVGQCCRRLHFLQGVGGDPHIDGSTVARWIVHYVDGSSREWAVTYGDHVRDLIWRMNEEPLEARNAKVVWRGRWTGLVPDGAGARLFESTWTNPEPALEISQLEFRVAETAMKPLVVAITAE
jgi:WD40 repeat protein